MPIQIPRYEQAQVNPQGEPNARVSTDAPLSAFGGGGALAQAAEAGQGLLSEVKRVQDKQREEADQLVVDEFNANLSRTKNKLIFDPETGLMTKKGKNAFGAPEEYGERFDKEVEELKKGLLFNDRQRAMAQRLVLQHKTDLDGNINRHVYGEMERYDDETTMANISAAQDEAVLHLQDPGKVQASIQAQRDLIERYGQRKGLDKAAIDQKIAEVTGKTHASVIDRMLTNDQDLMAKHYFDAIKGDIKDGDTLKSIEKSLEEGTLRGESQRLADQFMKQKGMASALEEAKKIEDPKLRDATRDRIQREFSLQEAARRDFQEKFHMQALNVLDQSKGDIDLVMKNPSWKGLDQGTRDGIMRYAKLKAEGGHPSTDWNEFYNLKTMASTPDLRPKFLQANLMEYRNKMADPEFKQLIDLQTSLRKGDGKAASHLDGFRSDHEIINGVLADAGFNTKARPGTEEIKRINLFKAKVDAEVERLQKDSGKKISNQELKAIADRYMIESQTDDGLFGTGFFATKKRAFELDPPRQMQVADTVTIPKEERAKLEAALRKRNYPVTEQSMLRLYKSRIGGMSGGR